MRREIPESYISRYSLYSWGILIFVILIQIVRFKSLPQFVDGYYHLHMAESLLRNNGWTPINNFDYAPRGIPNLYAPLYHIILSLLIKTGISKLTVLRITGTISPIIFLLALYKTVSLLFSPKTAFLCLLLCFSSLPFYACLAANIPATLALSFFLMSIYESGRGNFALNLMWAGLGMYTHSGIALSFILGNMLFSAFTGGKNSLKTALLSMFFALPLFIHQINNLEFLSPKFLIENKLLQINIFFTALAFVSLLLSVKEKGSWLKISLWAVSLGLVFYKYPYRLLSGQGMLFINLLSAILITRILPKMGQKFSKTVLALIIIYASLLNLVFIPWANKEKVRNSSTLYNIISKKIANMLEFNCLYYPKYYLPIAEKIRQNSLPGEIIASNNTIAGVIFGALTNRPVTSSLFLENRPQSNYNPFLPAKIIVWLKSPTLEEEKREREKLLFYRRRLKWQRLAELPICYIYLNPGKTPKVISLKPLLPLSYLHTGIILYFLAILLLYLKPKKPLHKQQDDYNKNKLAG